MARPEESLPSPATRAALVGRVQALQPGYELGRVAYKAPPWTYAFLAAWFAALRVPELVALNLAVVPLGLFAGRLHARGEMVRAFAVGLGTTALHAWVSSFCVGWDAGYGFFLVPLCVFAAFSLDLVALFESLPGEDRLRVGIATGPVVAGVIGAREFAYDAWGDTVNTAAQMESHGLPGRVHVDHATRHLLGEDFHFEDRGEVEVRGKGTLRTWFLLRRAAPPAAA